MAKRRTGETMVIADDETRGYVLHALEGRFQTVGYDLADMVRKEEPTHSAVELVEVARRLVAAYDAWLQAGGG